MNKKFSTLMAGLMLASAFSVNAQTASGKYEDGKYYVLGSWDKSNGKPGKILSVESDRNAGASFGRLTLTNYSAKLEAVREALWKVTVTQEKLGDTPTYSFVNVATGQVLSVSTPKDKNDIIGDNENVMISGGFMEWYNGLSSTGISVSGNPMMSYLDKNEVVYLDINNNKLLVKRGTPADANGSGLKIIPIEAGIVNLTADELNHELIMNNKIDDKATFSLSFDRDVTEDAATNLFAATPLRAIPMYKKNGVYTESSDGTATPYVRLYSKDNGYLVVDTTLHAGSEALKQLPRFAYDDPYKDVVEGGNNVARLPESFNFRFAYDPTENRVLIKAEKYAKKIASTVNDGKPVKVKGADGNEAYTYWPTSAAIDASKVKAEFVSGAYIRLVELSGVRELTVASAVADTDWSEPDDLENGMLTKVTIGTGLMSYVPTTIPTGLYTIQYKGSNRDEKATDNYYIANLGGAFGYAEQAKNQLFDHMPAAQWYVKQNGDIATAPVTITNREFFDVEQVDYDGDDVLENAFGDKFQYQAFQAPDGSVFFLGGAFANDTLKFIPVSAESKADSLLGYKHVDEKQASVETYVFNYLHGLSKDNGLNTPSDKDSLVRVDETGEKVAFRLIPVVEHDNYGMQLSAADVKATGIANLLRNAYYVEAYDNLKFAEDGENRYLRYDENSKKYVMSKTPKAYFLKENNCIDGNHYYALVEANVLKTSLSTLKSKAGSLEFYAPEFAGMSLKEDQVKSYNDIYKEINSKQGANKASEYLENTIFFPLDKNGQPVVTDASNVALYAYQADVKGEKVVLRRISKGSPVVYAYMNKVSGTTGIDFGAYDTKNYASSRVSVDDNTLDLTNAVLSDKFTQSEIRVSAFEVAKNDAPLYRRFNGANGEFGTAENAPLNLKFYRFNNDQEYLFENYSSENSYRDGITDKEISFLGVNNAKQFAENETRSYTMYVDTAYVRNNTRMPQYLIGVKPEVVPGDTIWCNATSAHHHDTLADSLACDHTIINAGFTRAMYLFNAQDSVDVKNYDYQGKAAYGAAGYTRLAFKDAVHANDTLYILNPGVTTEQLKATNLKDGSLFADKINLGNNDHKNVVFQFRLIDEDNNRFLIESESDPEMIAPMKGGWIKVQNGVPVIARFDTFQEAIRQAEVFDVNDEIKYDAVDNEEIAVEGVSVVAGNGQVTIMGAAGKNVTITNILGKVIASQVIASDNATIAVPAGIVAVAVEGEAAVKAIVK